MFVLAAYFEPLEVRRWLDAGGYGALFGLLFSCGLGFPLPEDVPLIASGILIADHRMHLAIAAPWHGSASSPAIAFFTPSAIVTETAS